MAQVSCPHCGESIDTFPDPSGGEEQEYIEDCAVCCRPILFIATFDPDVAEFSLEVSAEV